ncbi:MAG: outer membrane protein assembly factor BamD [marine benthic group bacterium]|nr:outer membrane protein assembly factor BamD [Gemmatimonadota bacterium]
MRGMLNLGSRYGGTSRLAAGRRVVFAIAVMAYGCAPAMPPPDSTPRQRYDWSAERFEDGKYTQAIRGFRDHLFRDPLHSTADSTRLLLAESYLESDQELLAANEFRQLATTRPNSPLADDSQFGVCRSYWKLSPDIARDQEFTRNTIEECTRLVEFYPRSPLAPDARAIIAEANEKLAAKELRVGRWYFSRDLYQSSIIYLESVLESYPGSSVEPEVLALLYDAYSYVGFSREAEQVRERLLQAYPDSEQASEMTIQSEPGDS